MRKLLLSLVLGLFAANLWAGAVYDPILGVMRWDFGVDTSAFLAAPASPEQGDIMYYSGSAWVVLHHGTAGQILETQGNAANPHWVDAPEGGEGGALGKMTVADKTDDYAVQTGDVAKTLTMTHGSTKTFSLPSVAAGDVGTWFTFVKLGAGKVVIDAADSDTIGDSGAGDTIYDDVAGELTATITLQLISETKWVVVAFNGTWTTTD